MGSRIFALALVGVVFGNGAHGSRFFRDTIYKARLDSGKRGIRCAVGELVGIFLKVLEFLEAVCIADIIIEPLLMAWEGTFSLQDWDEALSLAMDYYVMQFLRWKHHSRQKR